MPKKQKKGKKSKKRAQSPKKNQGLRDRLFLLSWKKLTWILFAWIFAVALHNFIYGLFKSYYDSVGGDEPFFFIIAVIIIPIYIVGVLIYSLLRVLKDNRYRIDKRGIIAIIIGLIAGLLLNLISSFDFPLIPIVFGFIIALIVYWITELNKRR